MKYLLYPLWLLWRLWFYILIAVQILLLFPLLILSISREEWYPYFFRLARFWARNIMWGMGFGYKLYDAKPLESGRSYVFVANHTSMMDIMLMLAIVKHPFVFVGKKELAKIPLFGFFYKRTCILVDRENSKSRQAVFDRAHSRLSQGLSLCIFPEGLVPEDESIVLAPFKDGAFRLATEHRLSIVPFAFTDCKRLFSYRFFSGRPGLLRAHMLPLIHPEDPVFSDRKLLREHVFQLVYAKLVADKKYV